MRLLTFEAAGRSRLGAEWQGRIADLQNVAALAELVRYGAETAGEVVEAFRSDMLEYLRGGATTRSIAESALSWLEELPPEVADNLTGQSALLYREDQVRRRAPITRPGKIICIGLNYRDHAAESGLPVPQEPVLFCKYANTVIGPGDPIILPPDSAEVDYEAELVFVIGKTAHNVPEAQAMEYVAGYTVGHDVSARDYQIKRGGGQWMAGKTWDTFAPMGPVLVTADESIDPHNLGIRCVLNGEMLQNSNTSQFIFNIPQAVAYLSRIITLEPGDTVVTGTPPGVGLARNPPHIQKPGDGVEITNDGNGNLRNPVRAAK